MYENAHKATMPSRMCTEKARKVRNARTAKVGSIATQKTIFLTMTER